MDHEDLDDLAQRLAMLILKGLGRKSRWALRTGLDAAQTEGIAGMCVLRIPPKEKDYIDITFSTIGEA